MPVEALLKLLKIEVEELEVSLQFRTYEETAGEAVDVANFAFFIWDRMHNLYGIRRDDDV